MRQSPRGPDEPSVEAWYVLGGGPVGEQVARRLADIGLRVRYVDDSHESSVVPSHEADPTDVRGLETTGIGRAAWALSHDGGCRPGRGSRPRPGSYSVLGDGTA